MKLLPFLDRLKRYLTKHKDITVPAPPGPDEYPYLPNFQAWLDNKAYSNETIQDFFTRLGYPYVAYSEFPDPEIAHWAIALEIDCVSSVMRVSNAAKRLDLKIDMITSIGMDVGFVAFKTEADLFLFKLRFDFY